MGKSAAAEEERMMREVRVRIIKRYTVCKEAVRREIVGVL